MLADVHHHRETDHIGRTVETPKGILHLLRLRTEPPGLKPMYSDNADGAVRALINSGGGRDVPAPGERAGK
jgi:hypothetical protein